jgi:hypothetical protein
MIGGAPFQWISWSGRFAWQFLSFILGRGELKYYTNGLGFQEVIRIRFLSFQLSALKQDLTHILSLRCVET